MSELHFPRPIVVTGTGTDVGKTFVSQHLLREFRNAGTTPLGLKPVETGYDGATSDALALAIAAGHPSIAPCFVAAAAVSPHIAAREAGRQLQALEIADWVRRIRARQDGPCLVETAGGLFSPLSEVESMLDLVRALEPCVFVLVAPDRLGTLHDVSVALHASKALHRTPDAIILNPRQSNSLDNAGELARLGVTPRSFTLTTSASLGGLGAFLLDSVVHL